MIGRASTPASPPEYLAAILGVETYYGRLTGSYRVLDALATLAFDYPARAKFFREELEQFILLTRDLKLDPLAIKGSYAGAMGAPQFMPSNYRRYAVDANADGRIDLWTNWSDVCASVGNYLKEHGWNPGEPVLSEASVEPDKAADLDGRSLSLAETVATLQAKGVSFDSPLPPDAPAMLIAADEPDGVRWRVGYNNFYVITRYNHSALYAMAVYELAAAVKQRILMNDSPHPGDSPRPVDAPVVPVTAASPAAASGGADPRRDACRKAVNAGRPLAILVLAAAAGLSGCVGGPPRAGPCCGCPGAAGRGAAGAGAEPFLTQSRNSSRARATATRRFTTYSASATTCCPRAAPTWSAESHRGTGPGFTRFALRPGNPTTCTA